MKNHHKSIDTSLSLQKTNSGHKHRAIALHSPGQQGMFFALITDLGYLLEDAKERAKKRFNLLCFNDLKSGQMNELIDLLVKQKEYKEKMKLPIDKEQKHSVR